MQVVCTEYIQQIGNVTRFPEIYALITSIRNKCIASAVSGYTPITFTENENRYMQKTIQEEKESHKHILRDHMIMLIIIQKKLEASIVF